MSDSKKVTKGIFVDSMGISSDVDGERQIVIPKEMLKDIASPDMLILSVKSKKQFLIMEIENLNKTEMYSVVVYAKEHAGRLMMLVANNVFKPYNVETRWTTGVCTVQDSEMKKILGMDGCVWEGIIQFPNKWDINDIIKKIKDVDSENDNIVKNITNEKVEYFKLDS